MSKRPKAIAAGTLFDGAVDCYVLDDGRRVISQNGAVRALSGGARERGDLSVYINRLPSRFGHLTARAGLEFDMPNGGVAQGREGTWFVEVCDAYVDAFMSNELKSSQVKLAQSARGILKAVQVVGITALIDEATNYQSVRASDDLQRLLARVLRHEASRWECRFPPSLVRALAPLYGLAWTGGSYPRALQRPFGIIYDLVMGKDVMQGVRERNPKPAMGSNHHQLFQEPIQAALVTELHLVEYIAANSKTRASFWRKMRTHFRGVAQLDLIEDEMEGAA